jgi:DNA polymerase-3 subunit delta'
MAEPGAQSPPPPTQRLLGQETAETLLARAVERDTVGHAYLFLAPPGCGKSTAARLFAGAINCENQPAVSRDDSGLHLAPCGRCQSCRRILAGTHPEVMEVLPGSKTGQDVTIEQIRDIRRNAALQPKLGKRRVYIFPNAETVREVSANALLKTLEEPSPHVVILLCAPSPNHVLPTIRSRCQVIRFALCPPASIRDALTAGGTTHQIAEELARASGGRPGLAINWALSPSVLKARRAVLDVLHRAVKTQPEASRSAGAAILSLRLAEELRGLVGDSDADGPARPVKMLHSDNLEIGLGYLRDLMLLCTGAGPEFVQNQDRISELTELAAGTNPGRVLEDIRSVRQAQQLLERNVTPPLVLDRLFWALIAGPVPLPTGLFEEVAA